jgi:hypothetical protein
MAVRLGISVQERIFVSFAEVTLSESLNFGAPRAPARDFPPSNTGRILELSGGPVSLNNKK